MESEHERKGLRQWERRAGERPRELCFKSDCCLIDQGNSRRIAYEFHGDQERLA